MSHAEVAQEHTHALARAQTQGGLHMLDREIVLAGHDPYHAAQIPAAGVVRGEPERTVEEPDHGTDVLAEIRQHEGRVDKDARVVLSHLERLPSKIGGHAA